MHLHLAVSTSLLRRVSLVALFAALLLWNPGSIRAANVTVDCSVPGQTITAALASLDLIGPHTITVSGTCIEAVRLDLRNLVTIQAAEGSTATINPPASNVIVIGVTGSRRIVFNRLIIEGGTQGISIGDASEVTIRDSTIQNNSLWGISVHDQSRLQIYSSTLKSNANTNLRLERLSTAIIGEDNPSNTVKLSNSNSGIIAFDSLVDMRHTIVENHSGNGIQLYGGRLFMTGNQAENLVQGNITGLSLNQGAAATITGQNGIQNNVAFGLIASSSSATFNELVRSDGAVRVTVIEGQGNSGAVALDNAQISFGGRHKIRGNGCINCIVTIPAGLRAHAASTLRLGGGVEVTDNTGVGVHADESSVITVTGPLTVTNNTEDGIELEAQATVTFLMPPTGTSNTINSVTCDSTSVLYVSPPDAPTGVGKTDCKKAVPSTLKTK